MTAIPDIHNTFGAGRNPLTSILLPPHPTPEKFGTADSQPLITSQRTSGKIPPKSRRNTSETDTSGYLSGTSVEAADMQKTKKNTGEDFFSAQEEKKISPEDISTSPEEFFSTLEEKKSSQEDTLTSQEDFFSSQEEFYFSQEEFFSSREDFFSAQENALTSYEVILSSQADFYRFNQ
jgi:hypothetical protein